MSKLIRVIAVSKDSAEMSVGAATMTFVKRRSGLKAIVKYPRECRVPKKLMHEAYIAAAEAIKEAQPKG